MSVTEQLQAVLDRAHAGHVYVTDREKHGVPEDWRPELVGDCDSFALWCRDRLREAGITDATLVFCGVDKPTGDHLVCTTPDGWVLDNRHRWLMRRDDLPYTWISYKAADGHWYRIEG